MIPSLEVFENKPSIDLHSLPQKADEDVSLYIHVPFCKKKCPYCHFYVQLEEEKAKDILYQALQTEWHKKLYLLQGKQLSSIYFGGGTPTLLGVQRLKGLLELFLKSDLSLSIDHEVTIEGNPESLTLEKLKELHETGFNRLSIGVQSFDNDLLTILGRDHSAEDALRVIHQASLVGFSNISIDLMYEIPYQNFSSWKKTVQIVSELPLTHLSLYNLTFEENTPFYRKKDILQKFLPKEEMSIHMLELASNNWEKIGLFRYEISAFAKKNFYSKHNTGYWTARPFLGLGPSAFSYYNKKRFQNASSLKDYALRLKENKDTIAFSEELSYPQNIRELLAIQLRLLSGVSLDSFQKKHGDIDTETIQTLNKLIIEGFLKRKNQVFSLTKKGMLFYDYLASELI